MIFTHQRAKIRCNTHYLLEESHLFNNPDINLWSRIWRESIDSVLCQAVPGIQEKDKARFFSKRKAVSLLPCVQCRLSCLSRISEAPRSMRYGLCDTPLTHLRCTAAPSLEGLPHRRPPVFFWFSLKFRK